MEKNLDVTKPCYSEHLLTVPWPFVISPFHCDLQSDGWPEVLPLGQADGICMSDQFRSGKLPTYPSPNLKLTFVSHLGQNVHYRSVLTRVLLLTKYY